MRGIYRPSSPGHSLHVMRLMLMGVLVAACAAMPIQAQQTPAASPSAGDSAQRMQRSASGVVLPPEPIEHVGSGDSAARAARALVYVARGEAAKQAGMRDTARAAFEKALDEDFRCSDAVVDLARMMVEEGDGRRAQSLLETALRRDPTNPKLLHFSARRIGAPPDSSSQQQ
jgi:tetratricopeptide (TPR) repeat protein